PATICLALNSGPERTLRYSFCPVARIFTCVPPTSTTSTFRWDPRGIPRIPCECERPMLQTINVGQLRPSTDYGLLECSRLLTDHRHQVVPGLHERLRSFIL